MFKLNRSRKNKPKLSIVIVCYNMQREIIRTIKSLLPPYQLDITNNEVELLIVDNGSDTEVDFGDLNQDIVYLKYPNPTQSPAAAINYGIEKASAEFVGVFVDGARMASPGLCREALMAHKISKRTVIGTLAYHIGPDVQMNTVFQGYDQAVEDEILSVIDWYNNGYDLFSVSTLAGSSHQGLFQPIAETNALFMNKGLWKELNGFDERFVSVGGGLVNLDVYTRIGGLTNTELVMLLSEATFHQVHGGVATNNKIGAHWHQFCKEYEGIHGEKFYKSTTPPFYFGKLNPKANWVMQKSSTHLENDQKLRKKLNNLFQSRFVDLSF